MKRHASLAPLSRDHHTALILAQLLKKDAPLYKGLPDTTEGKLNYAKAYFKADLKEHFKKEEKIFDVVKEFNADLKLMVAALLEEHTLLAKLFLSLTESEEAVMEMDHLANVLSSHIRKEERELFPLIQESCNESQLAILAQLIDE